MSEETQKTGHIESNTTEQSSSSGETDGVKYERHISSDTKETIDNVLDRPGFLDIVQMKVISRKFLVWVTTTTLLLCNKLTPKEWLYVSMIYVGSSAVISLVSLLKGENKEGSM